MANDIQFKTLFDAVESSLATVELHEGRIKELLVENKDYLESEGFTTGSFKAFVKAVMADKLQDVIEKGELFKNSYQRVK